MTDDQIEDVIAGVGRRARVESVRRLLAGNDTCCFTSDQYREMYDRVLPPFSDIRDALWEEGMADRHLRSIPWVWEVSPGVWTGDPPKKRA